MVATKTKKPKDTKRVNQIRQPIRNGKIDQAGLQLEKARAASAESKQPRFAINRQGVKNLFDSIYGFTKGSIFKEPRYIKDSSKRDTWLAGVVPQEPYLMGILQSVVSIDKNRGWNMIGGRNQVKRFVDVLHNFQVAPDLAGWRNGMSVSARNYYQADLGAVVETLRTVENGPLAGLYTVDPTKCYLTGDPAAPLRYTQGKRDQQYWEPMDYFRVTSFPSTNEDMNGLGYCAVSRCIELAKLLVSVYEHDREKLGSRAPKGILVINGGMTLDEWLKSLEESQYERSELEREFYTGVQTLLGGDGQDITVTLTSLSDLPENFDQRTFVDMIIYGYALAFGYDPREFWPVSSGSLGSSLESESQHRRASTKGGLDFALGFQESLQGELPASVDFEFEQRDVAGDIAEAEYRKAEADVIMGMYESKGGTDGVGLIDRNEGRRMLVEAEVIPEDFTPDDEIKQIQDTDDVGSDDALLERERVQRAMEKFPGEDIVIFSSRKSKFRTIRKAGDRRVMARGVDLKRSIAEKKRQYDGDYTTSRAAFEDAVYTLVRDYLDSSDRSTSFKSAMKRNVVEAYQSAVENGYIDGGSELPLEDDVDEFLTSSTNEQLGYVDDLFDSLKDLRDSGEVDVNKEAEERASGYTHSLDGAYNKAVMFGAGNKMLTFTGSDGEKSCATCQMLQGQRHRASWWLDNEYVPPTGAGLDCAPGGHCEHQLVDDDGNQVTL